MRFDEWRHRLFKEGQIYDGPQTKKKNPLKLIVLAVQPSKNRRLQSREADVEESYCYSRFPSRITNLTLTNGSITLQKQTPIHIRPQPPSVRRSTRQPIFWIHFWRISWCGKWRGFACLEWAHTNQRISYYISKLLLKSLGRGERRRVLGVIGGLYSAHGSCPVHLHALTNHLCCSIFVVGEAAASTWYSTAVIPA